MFGKRVKALIWNDFLPGQSDARRWFVANYIFDDGFASLEECKEAVPSPEMWAYVCFCDNWYAVNADSYYRLIVVSKENIHISTGQWQKADSIPSDIEFHDIGQKLWTQGIFSDFKVIDPALCVVDSEGYQFDAVTTSNTVVAFGIPFFTNFIKIKNDRYVRHILAHYYNDNSMAEKMMRVRELREYGFEYWNPMSDEFVYDENAKNRIKRNAEKGIDMGEVHDNRPIIGRYAAMTAEDELAALKSLKPYGNNRWR